ncbi:hypothetical protein HOG98_04885 [bacterium]|jgi:hypothetical protein|nr:hypothetical protein [bacterium]
MDKNQNYFLLNGRTFDKISKTFSVTNLLVKNGKVSGIGYLPDDLDVPVYDLDRAYIFHNITDSYSIKTPPSKEKTSDVVFEGVPDLDKLSITTKGFSIPFPHQVIKPSEIHSFKPDNRISFFIYPIQSKSDILLFEKLKQENPSSQLFGGVSWDYFNEKSNVLSSDKEFISYGIKNGTLNWVSGNSENNSVSNALSNWILKKIGTIEEFALALISSNHSLLNIKPAGLTLFQKPNVLILKENKQTSPTNDKKSWDTIMTIHQGEIQKNTLSQQKAY